MGRHGDNTALTPRSPAEIVEELGTYTGAFPRQAFDEAIRRKEELIPELLAVLRSTADRAEEVAAGESYWRHMSAIFLLAQFRESRACPLILELARLPGELLEGIFGDVLTESLGRILASVCGDETRPLEALIADRGRDEFARTAGIEALTALVATGQKSRQEVLSFYRSLLEGGLEREYSYVWNALVRSCCRLHPGDLVQLIRQAYEEELIESGVVGMEDVIEAAGRDPERVLGELRSDERYTLIDDVIHELEGWECFSPRPGKRRSPSITDKQMAKALKELQEPRGEDDENENVPGPAMREGPKVGRNAPCPCGSGRKDKHCCGG